MSYENNLVKQIHGLLDECNYKEAKEILLAIKLDFTNDYPILYTGEVAGLLIDLGVESSDEEVILLGVKILENNKEVFEKKISVQSINYNLGNANEALYKIKNTNNQLPTLEDIEPHLNNSKNYFLKAFKETDFSQINDIDLKILTNLGNNLSQCGRLLEAIQLSEAVLKNKDDHPHALISLAVNLDTWLNISFSYPTQAIFLRIYLLLKKGLDAGFLPREKKKYFHLMMRKYEILLENSNFSNENIEKELSRNMREYSKLSSFRRYCIENHLTLNEHALYCTCTYTKKDDLSIVQSRNSVYGNKIGKMELLLNRLKSEFSLARKLYYEGIGTTGPTQEIIYSELSDGEVIGECSEKLRISFRICFGIFDKIANGICYFMDLPKGKREYIYFEKFWNSPNCKERWEKLKAHQNPHLVALYSISTDFNSKDGEFNFYKQWRNMLEHNNLILINGQSIDSIYELFDDEKFVTTVPYLFFKDEGLHLLQMCCAAIFSYTYLIRTESFTKEENELSVPIIVQSK